MAASHRTPVGGPVAARAPGSLAGLAGRLTEGSAAADADVEVVLGLAVVTVVVDAFVEVETLVGVVTPAVVVGPVPLELTIVNGAENSFGAVKSF
jgi:hypothetical protein